MTDNTGMGSTPNAAELMRRMDEIVARLDRLASTLEIGYVRKDVQDAREIATNLQMKGLEDDVHHVNKRIDKAEERQTATWRLALAGLIYPLIVGAILYLIVGSVVHH